MSVSLRIEIDREDDGRWLAEVPDIPGVLCHGSTRDEAVARVQALALRVLAERLELSEAPAELLVRQACCERLRMLRGTEPGATDPVRRREGRVSDD
jgi:predicted RNase H-like HicB family nuclease